jgi:hypothetical protein
MENTIDFFFNPLFKEGTEFVLQNVRNVYSSDISKIFVWIDNDYIIKNEIIDITNKYKATAIQSTGKFTWCSSSNAIESKQRLLEWCRRLQKTAELSSAKWIMYLEDDVLVRGKVTQFPTTSAGVNPGIVASGGSIHLASTIRTIFQKYSNDELLEIMKPHPFYFAADRLLLKLYSDNGYEFSVLKQLADGIPPDQTDKPILHNIKTHYPSYWREYREYLNGKTNTNPMESLI